MSATDLVLMFLSLGTYTVTYVKFYFIAFPGQLSGYFQLRTHQSHPWSLLKYTSVSESYFGSCKVEFAGIGLKYLHSELFYRRFLCACLRMAAEIFVNWRICKGLRIYHL